MAIAFALLTARRLSARSASEGSPAASLAAVLSHDGLRVRTDTIVWLADDEGPWHVRPALFLAARGEELDDLWYAELRPASGGAVLDVSSVTNITRSAGAAEEQLTRVADHLAFASRAGGRIEAVTVLGLAGEPSELTQSWTSVQRGQNAITNVQETGRAEGFDRVRYQLRETEAEGTLSAEGERFVLAAGATRLVLAPGTVEPIEGADRVDAHPLEKGVPGGITWVVDTVRNLSFVGPEPIEWLENRVFAVQDWWDRTRYAWFGSSSETEEEVASELSLPTTRVEDLAEEQRALLTVAEAELGWPPPPMQRVLEDEVEGEGEWRLVIDDPFVNQYPGAPPAFAQSFIRPDRERPYARVYVVLWDSRQVQLRIMPGTREPESATGQRGAGYVPRDELTSRMLVGAFDGGFQAMHGEFGMMADAYVYLPPKPWAATIAVFEDGHVGMGSWPAPDWRGRYYDERLATRQIPEGMIDMRQNLTSMVEDGVWNPWERWWWGAAPHEASEQTFTYRSGVCLTQEGFMAFFWGSSLGPEALGQAMVSARCARAMHLDMNSGHCGFEFFRPYHAEPQPGDAPLPPIDGRLHAESEYDGEFEGAPRGLRVRARKAVRSMAMRFPRYTSHEQRDFFYLTLRPTLPGPGFSHGGAEHTLSSAGLPHAGWPYAFARADVGGTWLVRIDPRRAIAAPLRSERHQRVLAGLTTAGTGPRCVLARRQTIGVAYAVGGAGGEGEHAIVCGAPATDASTTAIGVDRDGFLVYAEGPAALAVVTSAGGRDAIDPAGAQLAFAVDGGTAAAPDGLTERSLAEGAVLLYAEEQAAAEVIFPETRPMPYSQWGYLQGQRVRYFPTQPPRFIRPEE